MDFQVGDRVKLKSVDYLKRTFHLFEDQLQGIIDNQGKIFKIVECDPDVRSVVLDKPIFGELYNQGSCEIVTEAITLHERAVYISLPAQLFEI